MISVTEFPFFYAFKNCITYVDAEEFYDRSSDHK
jgi:hypothetical protein